MLQQNISSKTSYDTDLTDAAWARIEPLIPPPKSGKQGGRKREVNIREVLNAIFYLLRTGCAWRLLPHDFPNWPVVYHYFRSWKKDGTWKHIHDALREDVRTKAGKEKEPSAAILDSQSVKTTEKGGFPAMTRARRLRDANGIFSWTLLVLS